MGSGILPNFVSEDTICRLSLGHYKIEVRGEDEDPGGGAGVKSTQGCSLKHVAMCW